MREKFEKFLGLEVRLKDGSIIYQEDKGRYRTSKFDASFINGAWYAYQEQQKIINHQNQRAIDQAAHLHRVQEHNAKLQKRLKENGLIWQDLI